LSLRWFIATTALVGTSLGQAQPCDLYPIALSSQTLAGRSVGSIVTNISNGSQPGNFGWLTWGGSPSETTLLTSFEFLDAGHLFSPVLLAP